MAESNIPPTELNFADPIRVTIENTPAKTKKGLSRAEIIDIIKWAIGTVGLAVLSLVFNHTNSNTNDANLIAGVAKLDTNTLAKLNYFTNIRPLISSAATRDSITKIINNINTAYNPGKLAKVISSATASIGNTATPPNPKQNAAFKTQEQQSLVKTTPVSMDNLFAAENKVDTATSVVTESIVKKIQESKILNTPPKIPSYAISGLPQTLWCKRNYYVIFSDVLQAGVNDLDNSAQSINLTLTDLTTQKVLYNDTTLKVGNTLSAEINGNKYVLSLDYIGKAGKNPFTRAAYLSVSTYIKQ